VKTLDTASIVFLLLGTVAGIAAIYYSFGIVREWFRQRQRTGKSSMRGTDAAGSLLDGHIVTQWTEGRLRLDSILTLIKSLATSLEQEVETLRRIDHADPGMNAKSVRGSNPPCAASPSISIYGMSAAC
jgi:hypothetical protein